MLHWIRRADRHVPRLRAHMPTIAAAIGFLLFAGLIVGTCRDPQPRTLPPPSNTSTTATAPPTTDPDFSRVALPEVPGETTTTAPRTTGFATLKGVVQGPDGAVPGAVVRAERLVGDIVQPFDVRTGADGAFELSGVPGGRYRVRAFLPPTLAMDEPQIFYQPDFEERELRLVVEPFTGLIVRGDTAPQSPIVGYGVNLAVRVTERRVDDDGIAREVPVPGTPIRVIATGWTSLGSDSAITGADGTAVFEYRCDRVGAVSVTAYVGAPEEPFSLDVPGCSPVPTTTTTTSTTEPDDDDSTSSSTTTTRG